MEVIIKELEKAIRFQKSNKYNLYISLENIQVATKNFSNDKCIKEGRYWKQYEGQIPLANTNEHTIVVVKQFDNKSDEGRYSDEMGERIICYENTPNGRLSKCVQDASLSWMQRMKICIDIATKLGFLHKGYMVVLYEYFIDQVAFDGIKEQINAKSGNKFFKVAFQCGKDIESPWRVSKSLDKALEAQEDHEMFIQPPLSLSKNPKRIHPLYVLRYSTSEDEENSRMSFSQAGEDDAGALDRNVNLVEYLEF
ncbi:kinase-like domain, phloem protein 2-like protein [Tanacetum coccineum]